ncbi:MAG: beta-glucuronidase [Lachnospiraceae bacterium]|jgi:beta-glucuronidase
MLYPTMTPSRTMMDLSGIWNFKLDDGTAFDDKWYEKPLENPMTMAVPSSYNDLKEGAAIRDHYGWVFYQRTISLPTFVMKTQRVILRCDAVTHHAVVWLNGEKLAEHKCGFLPFEVELNGHMKPGENLLTIGVSNIIDYTTLPVGGKSGLFTMGSAGSEQEKKQNNPNFDFFNYCGITRPVRLVTTPKTWIDDLTVTASFPGAVEEGTASLLHCETVIKGAAASGLDCRIEVLDHEGQKVAGTEVKAGADENGAARAGADLRLEKTHLWQPLHAYLYQIRVTAGEDEYVLPYGVRTVRVSGHQFLINEKPFYFKGYGKHEDTFPAGRGMNLPMDVKDISLMKWQGANSFRTSHYPYAEEMMRLCDEEGIVVIDETTAVGVNLDFGGGANFQGQKVHTFDKEHGVQTFEHHKEVIRDLIDRDKNHACVVMWSIANEPDSYSEGAYEYFEPLFSLARKLDPQKRPCTLISVQMAGGPDRDVSAKLSDVICLNRYYGWYFGGPDLEGSRAALEKELAEWEKTGKPVMFTEFGADTVAGLHDTTPVMYTEEYQVDYYKMHSEVFDARLFIVGEQVWNFADFATSQSLLRVQGNKKGLFTRDRKPKLAAHYFRERWNAIPDFGYKTE